MRRIVILAASVLIIFIIAFGIRGLKNYMDGSSNRLKKSMAENLPMTKFLSHEYLTLISPGHRHKTLVNGFVEAN